MRIHVKGTEAPIPITSFTQMPIEDKQIRRVLLKNIEKSNYKEPTAIQMQSIPVLLHNYDCIGIAPTGSGKTAAYLIPMISKLRGTVVGGIRALILVPTRELANQIQRDVMMLTIGKKFRICLLSKVFIYILFN